MLLIVIAGSELRGGLLQSANCSWMLQNFSTSCRSLLGTVCMLLAVVITNRQKDTDLVRTVVAAVADVVKANNTKDTDLASIVVAAVAVVAGSCRMPAWAGAIRPTPPPWSPGLQHDTAACTL